MESLLNELKNRLYEVADFEHAASVLSWDMATYMPQGGAPRRGRSISTMSRLRHERFTDKAIGHLLDQLEPLVAGLPYDDDNAALVRRTRKEYDKAVKVPSELVGRVSSHISGLYDAWTRARPANDFASLAPMLEKELDLYREVSDCFPGYKHVNDPHIDGEDAGFTVETIRAVFSKLRSELVPIVQAIAEKADPSDDAPIRQLFPISGQEAFGLRVSRDYGYDFQRGRQDLTHHPFATRFAHGDVRITTRYKEQYLGDGLFGTLHESGHAMYEQGIAAALDGTPLGHGTSNGVHESQSRTWENIVGRSLPFWEHYYPALQETFPDALKDVPLERFYLAINAVKPSLIRVDADEVTYNLHVMIRFDLEADLMDGTLSVRDLPEVWQTRYDSDLGVTAPDDRDGVLQDVHWYDGIIGYFQGYTLGNIMSAQFYNAALAAHPYLPDHFRQGKFDTLHTWLKENIYQHGGKYTADELLARITGSSLDTAPWIQYIRTKYGALYGI
ncbi:MAG: carboxypeptidase M32 [Pleurocapsa minor GSE-CHR-MK-17-07R]|nr:carboxypeptidase M32 [Pleurocapsa minor GSE-CHR-MK 17-07R]